MGDWEERGVWVKNLGLFFFSRCVRGEGLRLRGAADRSGVAGQPTVVETMRDMVSYTIHWAFSGLG